MKKTLAQLALPCLLAPLSSHAIDDRALPMVYAPVSAPRLGNHNSGPTEASRTATPLDGCHLAVRRIDDLRPNKETAGAAILMREGDPSAVPLDAASIRTGDATAWLKGALDSLESAGAQRGGALTQDGFDVALRLAHAWNASTNLQSHVVLQASFPGSGIRQVRRYHGFATRMNGMNGNAEYMEALNMGMQDALQQLARDLERVCRGQAL